MLFLCINIPTLKIEMLTGNSFYIRLKKDGLLNLTIS